MPSRRVCSAASAGIRVSYNSFGKRVDGYTPSGSGYISSTPTRPSRHTGKSVRFQETSDNDNSVNERIQCEKESPTMEPCWNESPIMEPLYATVRKRNSPTRERSGFVPQVPLNIQPRNGLSELDGSGETGFRPYRHQTTRNRHFRQNTELWINDGYKVDILGFSTPSCPCPWSPCIMLTVSSVSSDYPPSFC